MKRENMDTTKIRVGLVTTVNLGNFENVKFEIMVDDFCREGETASSAIDRIYFLVEKKILEKVEEYNGK
jgi:hypothetical protein